MDPNTPQGSCSWFEPTIFSWEQWIGGLLLIGSLDSSLDPTCKRHSQWNQGVTS